MKRHSNLFSQIVELDNIRLAYQKARKGKSSKSAIKRFDKDPEKRIIEIRDSLINNTFTTSNYETKWVKEPKSRLVYVLPFNPDRVVQHAIMNILEPIWEKLFIDDSYACRIGKGIHLGSKKCMEFVRKYKYCLKCDISKFYPSVNHDILFDIIRHKIKCSPTLSLLKEIIYSIPGGKNIPIGNYTSQWFGNLYLNELDQYIKHQHKVKPYIRYCDDFILFDNNKRVLNNLSHKIIDFCKDTLALTLSKCDLFPVTQGVDFLGYRHFNNYILLRKSTTRRVMRRLKLLPTLLEKGRLSIDSYRSSLASTWGWLKWSNTHNLRLSLKLDELLGATVV
jgi:RNA-directed DNA polymerase